jgi:ribosomal protein L11 methylase PrmA
VIIEYLPMMSKGVRPGAWGVFSGVNATNAAAVRKACVDNGWRLNREITDGDWHGFYLERA